MKKKYTVSLILLLFFCLVGPLTAAAETIEVVERNTLTLDEVLETTLKNNLDYRNARTEVEQFFLMRRRAADRIDMVPPPLPNTPANLAQQHLNLVQRDLAWQQKRKELDLMRDQILYRATEKYYELAKEQMNVAFMKEKVALHEWQHQIETIQFKLGVISRSDQLVNRKKLEDSKLALERATSDLHGTRQVLNELMRINRDTDYKVVDYLSLQPLENFNLQRHISNLKTNSVFIWLANSMVDFRQLELNLYNFDNEFNPLPYPAARLNRTMAETNVIKSEEQMDNNARAAHRGLVALEDALQRQEVQKEIVEQELLKINAQVEAGVATAFQKALVEMNLRELELRRGEMIIQHSLLREVLSRPWVLGGGMM